MSDVWFDILTKAFWCGFAALGFGILFNAPPRTLMAIWSGGFLGGVIKFFLIQTAGAGIITSTFCASVCIGVVSVPIAHLRHVPPVIFAIPAVIPLVPGVTAYRTMLGLMRMAGTVGDTYPTVFMETVHNGVVTLFVVMSIALGVAVPLLVISKDSVKNIRLR